MPKKVTVPMSAVDRDTLSQLEYAMTFVSEDVLSYEINEKAMVIEAEISSEAASEAVSRKISELVDRYSKHEFGLREAVHFEQKRDLPVIDAWNGLLERKWATPVGAGQAILRGPAAQLLSLIDAKAEKEFARPFGAEMELYPSTILCETLDRCNHFTSFPEHIDFVGHLRQDLERP